MTRLDFMALLGEFLIDFDTALEDKELRELLAKRESAETIREHLTNNF